MYGWMMDGAGGLWTLWIVVPLLLVAALVALVVVLARRDVPRTGDDRSSARVILDERYARGEIDHEEYARRRDALDRR